MTILNEEQKQTFEEAARPLMKWMAENVHPHHSVVVEADHAKLLEGISPKIDDQEVIEEVKIEEYLID